MEGSAAKGKARIFNGQRKNNNIHAAHPVVKDELSESGAESDASVDETVYRSRPELPKPHVHMRSLESLIKDLDSARIDIDPEYQRDVVWTADRMTGLINSLMENYYIPPIILNKKTNSAVNGETSCDTLVCVDGKQRLSSVRAFVKGMIPCHDHRGEKWWFCNAPGTRRRRLLPPATKRLFLNKDFVTFQFSRLTPDQEEDLFSRVQMGIQLSPAEKMRARSGPWQELAKLFVEDFPAIYDLLKDRTRAKDFQVTLACFAQLLEVMQSTPTNKEPRFRAKQVALLKLINDKAPIDDVTKSHLASIWTTFSELVALDSDVFTNSSNYIRNGDSFPLLEMVGVTVLIWKHSETRSHELLLGDIKALRKALREYFSDLRAGEPSWKFVWEFILDLEAIRGPGDDTAATQTPQRQPSTSTVSSLEPVSGAQPVQQPPPIQSPQPAPALPAISKKRVAPETTSEGIFSQHSSDIIQNRTLLDALSRKRQRNYSRPPSLTVAHNDFLRDSSTDFKRSDQSDTPQRPSVGNEPVTTPFSTSCFLSKSFLSHFTRAVPLSQPDRAVGKGRTQDPTRETSIPPKTTTPNLNIAGRVHDCYSRADARSPRTEDQVNISTYRTPAPTPPSTSSSPQLQQSKLEIRNQGHKTATLSDSTQLPSSSTCSVTNTRGNVTPASPLETSLVYPKGQGPFAVRHTEQDMEGFIVPASPQTSFQFRPLTPTTVQSARSPFICSDIKIRKPVCRPTREQIEGAIDLTGDT